jgi:preprotein translocase subunit YajC
MKKALFLLLALPLTAFAETVKETPAQNQNSLWQTLIMIAIAILFFYFILWRPEQKRRKSMEKKRSSLKKGDIVTAMGIVGTVDRIKENTLILKMVDGSKIEMLKGAISDVKSLEETTEEKKEDEVTTSK